MAGAATTAMYEALDFTPGRIPEGAKVGVVQAYMAHHQAMSIIAIADALCGSIMRRRFHAEPIIRRRNFFFRSACRETSRSRGRPRKIPAATEIEHLTPEIQRRYSSPHSRIPRTQLLSNASYAVMLTSAGSGYSRWRNLDVTRWREDATCDDWGSYIFCAIREAARSGRPATSLTGVDPDSYRGCLLGGSRRSSSVRTVTIRTVMEVGVSPEERRRSPPRLLDQSRQSHP